MFNKKTISKYIKILRNNILRNNILRNNILRNNILRNTNYYVYIHKVQIITTYICT